MSDFVPETKLGLVSIPIISSNFHTDPETGENSVQDAILAMIDEVTKHHHQQVALAATLICEQAGVVLKTVSQEELNFGIQEAARVGIKLDSSTGIKEIYRGDLSNHKGDGAS